MTKWWGNDIVLRGFEASEQSGLCTDGGMTTKHFALPPLEVAVEDSSVRHSKGQEELSISQNVRNIQMTWDSRPYFSQSGMGPEISSKVPGKVSTAGLGTSLTVTRIVSAQ